MRDGDDEAPSPPRPVCLRFSKHQRPSSTTLEVSKHIHVDHPQHSVELDNTEVLTTEPRWFERGVKEAYTSEPSTQASTEMEEGIIYHRYGTTSSRREWRHTGWGGGRGPRHHRPAQGPRQHDWDVFNWWSWQPWAKALVSWFYIILSIKCTKNCVIECYRVYSCICRACFNSYSASHDNWCTGTLLNRIMTAVGGDGGCRVGEVLPPCPTIRVLSYSNCQRSTTPFLSEFSEI